MLFLTSKTCHSHLTISGKKNLKSNHRLPRVTPPRHLRLKPSQEPRTLTMILAAFSLFALRKHMIKDSDMEAGSFLLETGSENCHSLNSQSPKYFIQGLTTLTQWVSTCGPGNYSSRITKTLVRNANS